MCLTRQPFEDPAPVIPSTQRLWVRRSIVHKPAWSAPPPTPVIPRASGQCGASSSPSAPLRACHHRSRPEGSCCAPYGTVDQLYVLTLDPMPLCFLSSTQGWGARRSIVHKPAWSAPPPTPVIPRASSQCGVSSSPSAPLRACRHRSRPEGSCIGPYSTVNQLYVLTLNPILLSFPSRPVCVVTTARQTRKDRVPACRPRRSTASRAKRGLPLPGRPSTRLTFASNPSASVSGWSSESCLERPS